MSPLPPWPPAAVAAAESSEPRLAAGVSLLLGATATGEDVVLVQDDDHRVDGAVRVRVRAVTPARPAALRFGGRTEEVGAVQPVLAIQPSLAPLLPDPFDFFRGRKLLPALLPRHCAR